MQFFNYVMRKVWLHQTRIGLSLYDVAGQGYLKESVSFSVICNSMTNVCTSCISEIILLFYLITSSMSVEYSQKLSCREECLGSRGSATPV